MEVFNKKMLDRQKQPAKLSEDPADQPKQASDSLIDDQAAYPDEKRPAVTAYNAIPAAAPSTAAKRITPLLP